MNIVITGANRGLGFELVKKFMGQGHHVAACYYPGAAYDDLQSLFKIDEKLLALIPMDVTKEEDVAKAAELIREKLYPVNAVISNAGILCDHDRQSNVLEMLAEDLRISLEVNLLGPAMVIRYFCPLVEKSMKSTFSCSKIILNMYT